MGGPGSGRRKGGSRTYKTGSTRISTKKTGGKARVTKIKTPSGKTLYKVGNKLFGNSSLANRETFKG